MSLFSSHFSFQQLLCMSWENLKASTYHETRTCLYLTKSGCSPRFQDKESSINLSNSHLPQRQLIVWRNEFVNHFLGLKRPQFLDCMSQLLVCFVHFLCRSHFDGQVFSNESKQGCREVDFSFFVDRHVHSYEFLVGKTIRTLVSKT